jgi:hypothetical protein
MPLDIATSPKNLTTILNYLKRGPEKPVRYVGEPPPGKVAWNGIDDPHEVRINDARGRESEFTLDRNGFALLRAPSQVQDFYSDKEVRSVYYPEVERLLRDTLGASRVFVFDHNVRNGGQPGRPAPSRQVHNDHTANSAPRRVRDHLGPGTSEASLRRGERLATDPGSGSRFAACDVRRTKLFGR